MTSRHISLEIWFNREVYKYRVAANLLLTAILLPTFSMVYILLAKLLWPLQEKDFISGISGTVFSLHYAVFTCLTTLVNLGLVLYNSTQYSVIAEVPVNRLELIVGYFRPHGVFRAGIFAFLGVFTTWQACNVIGGHFSSLVVSLYDSETRYLNEYHFFLILHGLYMSVLYHFSYYLWQYNYITFPIIKQAKYFHIKSLIVPLFLESAHQVVKQLLVFFPLYYFTGSIPRDWLVLFLGLKLSPEHSLDSLGKFLSLDLLLHTFLLGTFMHFTWQVLNLLLKIYLIQPFTFPVITPLEELDFQCLPNTLNCINDRYIQALGFFDLFILSKYSSERRKEIFSPSFPGGHPRNWNSICQACLSELKILGEKLQEYNHRAFISPLLQQQGCNASKKMGCSQPAYLKTSALRFRRNEMDSQSSFIPSGEVNKQPLENQTKKEFIKWKQTPLIGYFLRELPDAGTRRIFASAQIYIWAIEALSTLVAASYTEDSYGIVQPSLPEILGNLITLQESVERHFKLTANIGRKAPTGLRCTHDLLLRHAFRSALKSSIYRIVNTFGTYAMNFDLAPEVSRRLKLFLEYKE